MPHNKCCNISKIILFIQIGRNLPETAVNFKRKLSRLAKLSKIKSVNSFKEGVFRSFPVNIAL